MTSLASRKFNVGLADESETLARAARRVIFSADVLKNAKICTGDMVALSNGSNLASAKVRLNSTRCSPHVITSIDF